MLLEKSWKIVFMKKKRKAEDPVSCKLIGQKYIYLYEKNLLLVEFIDFVHVAEHNMLFAVDPRRDINTGVGHWFHVTLDTGEEQKVNRVLKSRFRKQTLSVTPQMPAFRDFQLKTTI